MNGSKVSKIHETIMKAFPKRFSSGFGMCRYLLCDSYVLVTLMVVILLVTNLGFWHNFASDIKQI